MPAESMYAGGEWAVKGEGPAQYAMPGENWNSRDDDTDEQINQVALDATTKVVKDARQQNQFVMSGGEWSVRDETDHTEVPEGVDDTNAAQND